MQKLQIFLILSVIIREAEVKTWQILPWRNPSCSRRNNTQQSENLFDIILWRKEHLPRDLWELKQKSKIQTGFDDEAPTHNLQNGLQV